jgi:hypothetical protein
MNKCPNCGKWTYTLRYFTCPKIKGKYVCKSHTCGRVYCSRCDIIYGMSSKIKEEKNDSA